MANPKTPGVITEEVSTFPSSVAAVPTAIPGFVGYTEKAVFPDGSSAIDIPVKISSLLEFETIFGGPYIEKYEVELTVTDEIVVTPDSTSSDEFSEYILYYQLSMFFRNGGGSCYIVSVSEYSSSATIVSSNLEQGISKLEEIDEVSLVLVPESVKADTDADIKNIYDSMLTHCQKMGDRMAILDALNNTGDTIVEDSDTFRNDNTGSENLKYGAAYYPDLVTNINYYHTLDSVVITDNRTTPPNDYGNAPNNTLRTIKNGISSFEEFTVASISAGDYVEFEVSTSLTIKLTAGADFAVGGSDQETTQNIINSINSNAILSNYIFAKPGSSNTQLYAISVVSGTAGNYDYTATGGISPASGTFASGANNSTNIDLFNQINTILLSNVVKLYPSGSMAGIYARTDSQRGVWKAPANTSVLGAIKPIVNITDQEQEGLNVTSSGKSINAIRTFKDRGTLVWGARTLDGNSNEWRYINVRRLFLFVEESIAKATSFAVFEPNTANTWTKVKKMSEAFLASIWREGGLAGASTQDAFYVKVGLGETMTAQDILEGKMIVEIGMAAVRPAEFIILKFSHKLQES